MKPTLTAAFAFLFMSKLAFAQSSELGIFTNEGDIGQVARPGSAKFKAALGDYVVSGGGENMWFTNDAFHYVWKEMRGDVAITADIRWNEPGGNAHRKAGVIIRQTLAPDSAYADVVVHGDGLTSLQYREVGGDLTHEIQSNVSNPSRIRLEKRGDYISISVAAPGGTLHPAGGSFRLQLKEPFQVGLGVCAHDNRRIESATFSKVELSQLAPATNAKPILQSTLEIIAIASTDRRVLYHTSDHIEAPNWSRDGKDLLFNSNGRIYRIPATGGVPKRIPTEPCIHCNNDHGISPDGTELVVSDQSQPDHQSRIYVLPITGGIPRLVTEKAPSYWHGWSPDGKTLAYCAQRDGEFDIYTIPVAGGPEQRLTKTPGLDDGPEYSPDGRFIYFNSDRTGLMQIWRMKPDGSDQAQVTSDEFNNWFAHPSPDGKWIVFLSYPKDVKGHPENKDVTLRLMPAAGGPIRVLARFFGGQGTINVPSWSPDSQRIAFVSYQLAEP